MKAFLMYRDQEFNLQQQLPPHEQVLIQDLELNTLFDAAAHGDKFLFEIVKSAVLSSRIEMDTIRYRQEILKDCLKNPSIVRELYQIPIASLENKKKLWLGIFGSSPSGILDSSITMLTMFVGLLKKLKDITDEHADKFESEGFTNFFAMIQKELDDEYFATIINHIQELRFHNGATISMGLGKGNEGTDLILRKPHPKNQNWVKRVFAQKSPVYSFSIHPRDDHGAKALAELKDRGINLVANAIAQSADHIDSFLKMLRIDLAFYIGCLNLYEQLVQMGEPVAYPIPVDSNLKEFSITGLYDLCLALTMKQKIVGNDVNADHKNLFIITGANQGGKSTFLRSVGLAQLMMRCGMFVPAKSFRANICEGVFTHYKRKEDASMKSGKLDEELARMSAIADRITLNSIILFNESFAATNEREGSEIARQITRALLEKNIKIFFVTHLYEFSHSFYDKKMENAIFLRAERQTDGARTFKLIEGEPLQTSFGEDVYKIVFQSAL